MCFKRVRKHSLQHFNILCFQKLEKRLCQLERLCGLKSETCHVYEVSIKDSIHEQSHCGHWVIKITSDTKITSRMGRTKRFCQVRFPTKKEFQFNTIQKLKVSQNVDLRECSVLEDLFSEVLCLDKRTEIKKIKV